MTTNRDYYEILGVSRDAELSEIKRAYRKLAVENHPDRNPDDPEAEERFKEAAEAYSVLSDSEKRARYDRFGHAGVSGAGGRGPGPGDFDPTVFGDFADILGDLFGFGDTFGGRRRSRRRRGGPRAAAGADLRYDVSLSFEEAAFGTEKTLTVPRLEVCPGCEGTGSKEGKAPSRCKACEGSGQVRFSQGFLTVARPCPQCRGEGVVVEEPCPQCRGQRRIEREREIEVKIPAGVDTGARLRLAGEGEHGVSGGPSGDLFVVIRVEEHPRFHREGPHVLSEEEISYSQAVLGGEVEVETVHGTTELEIPAGTEPGSQFRLEDEGVPRIDGRGRGDHIVQVRLRIPEVRKLDEEEREVLSRLAELEGRPIKERRTVTDRVKDLFH
ncbi:MAG: molecular chaperone DnaJ [Thermoanaerobaculia bacterium]|nr:molecular chaperone DnaJ [Thermoanaerobaculia bacterium]